MLGATPSPNGIGVFGNATDTTGTGTTGLPLTVGVFGNAHTVKGAGGLFRNAGTGCNTMATCAVLIGQANASNVFRVAGSGDVTASGNFQATTAGGGVIVKSPDGTKCALLGIDNTGVLSVTSVTCPAVP